MKKFKNTDFDDIRQYRKAIGLNQQEFWGKIGVTQSNGSRYENMRRLPNTVKILVMLVYGVQVDIKAIRPFQRHLQQQS